MRLNKVNITFVKTKIETFFREGTWKEVLVFLLFLVLSLGFWIMQSLQQTNELTVDIPVICANLPDNIALNNILPSTIEVKVQDMGSSLFKYAISNKKLSAISIDLQELNPKNRVHTISSEYIESECLKRLPASAKIISLSPASITINYAPLKKKKVPVLLNGTVEPASGFMLTRNVAFDPSEVTIYGSKETLDTITGVFTEKKNWSHLDHSVKLNLKLQPVSGIKFSTNHVNVLLYIEEYTEKVLEVPVVSKDFPSNYRLRTFPATVQVSCLLPLSKYATIHSEDFEAAVFYDAVSKNNSSTAPVVITQKPEFLDFYRYNPEQVEYLIEQIK